MKYNPKAEWDKKLEYKQSSYSNFKNPSFKFTITDVLKFKSLNLNTIISLLESNDDANVDFAISLFEARNFSFSNRLRSNFIDFKKENNMKYKHYFLDPISILPHGFIKKLKSLK